ncbi:MAG: DNA repair protein RecO [Acidobacteriota bacterium]|nr:DNA repair protein RecO [Acidobacteriota bacterium]
MREFRDDAVVLRTYRSGESDRAVVLWTREHGKVRVLAKGARRSTSRLGGTLEVLGFVRVDLVATRGEFYIARHVEHLERLTTLRADYERITAGYAVVEIVDAIPADDVADPAIFDLVVRVLRVLDDAEFSPRLVPAAFAFRLLALDGSAPVVDECVNCGRPGPLVAFDAQVGGTLCATCRSGRALSGEALALIRRLVGGDLGAALREAGPAGAGEVAAIATEAVEQHFGRRLKVARSTPPLEGRADR